MNRITAEMAAHPEFTNGTMNRRLGISKAQSCKHLRGMNHTDAYEANREGWDAMNVHLVLADICKQVEGVR